jgi:hypothetical protein
LREGITPSKATGKTPIANPIPSLLSVTSRITAAGRQQRVPRRASLQFQLTAGGRVAPML